MQLRLAVIALACLGLSAVATAAVAGPKKKAVKTMPSKASSVISPIKYLGPAVPTDPAIEQGDSAWVKGTVQYMQLDPQGRVQQIHLKNGSAIYQLNFSGACEANKRLQIAKHPELVTAWDSARKVSLGVRRRPGSTPSFCVFALGVMR